jgi:hypothetical protein
MNGGFTVKSLHDDFDTRINNQIKITPRPQSQGNVIESKLTPNELFETRQREYADMLKQEIPIEPNFQELTKDTAIENMTELVQQQIRQRELDVVNLTESFSPIVVADSNKSSEQPHEVSSTRSIKISTKPNSLQIMEELNVTDNSSIYELTPILNTISNSDNNTKIDEIMKLLLELKEEIREIKTFCSPNKNGDFSQELLDSVPNTFDRSLIIIPDRDPKE